MSINHSVALILFIGFSGCGKSETGRPANDPNEVVPIRATVGRDNGRPAIVPDMSSDVVPIRATVGWPHLKSKIHKIFSAFNLHPEAAFNSRNLSCDSGGLSLFEEDYLPGDILEKMKSLGNSISFDQTSLRQDDLDQRIFTSSIRDVPNEKGIKMMAVERIVKTFQCTSVAITFIVN